VWGAEETDRSGEAIAGAVGVQRPHKLAAVVGLEDQMRQIDATAIQVALDAVGKHRAGAGTAAGSERQEKQTAADLTGGVLNEG